MSIITDIRESRKLKLARSQPNLSFLPFSASGLLAEIHADLFPDVGQTVQLFFVAKGPLACIAHASEYGSIYIHQLLNHSETPVAVIGLILKHELLHLRIPPTIEDGKKVQHPPTFWEAERAIAPERHSAWAWIWENLWSCLNCYASLEFCNPSIGGQRLFVCIRGPIVVRLIDRVDFARDVGTGPMRGIGSTPVLGLVSM